MKEITVIYKAEITEIFKFPDGAETEHEKYEWEDLLKDEIKKTLDPDHVKVYDVKVFER